MRKYVHTREEDMVIMQPGILAPLPKAAWYVEFAIHDIAGLPRVIKTLQTLVDGERTVVGLGVPLFRALGKDIPGLRVFPTQFGSGLTVPSTPAALWCWLRAEDRGELFHVERRLLEQLTPAFTVCESTEGFLYGTGRDLTGYEDGTENPKGKLAEKAAIVRGQGAMLDGSSYVAVQRWVHDWKRFDEMSDPRHDAMIGRRRRDNKELATAPTSAHVKRTAQESFQPAAFVLRRSMPWADEHGSGLYFVAFGASLDPFEAQLKRMVGADDGIADALFTFTRPVTGSFYWCPPMENGRLNLSAIGV